MRFIWIIPVLTALFAVYQLPIPSESARESSLTALATVAMAWAIVPTCLCYAISKIFPSKSEEKKKQQ